MAILTKVGVVFDVSPFPKLKALHGALRADPALALYFASDMYKRYSESTCNMHMCTNHADAQDARAHGHVHVICGHHGRCYVSK